jgi:uncharacterized protein YcbK (DUF882 family)
VIRAALVALAFAASAVPAATAAADTATTTAAAVAPASKKDEYLAAKARAAATPAPRKPPTTTRKVGKPPPPVISLYNTWTHEWLALDADVKAALPATSSVDRFLRCHFTNEPTTMDGALARTLRDAARRFGSSRIDIVSGFRAPKYNLMLRKKGREVARDSQHTHGNAVDFRIPGVNVKALEAWARTLRLGGVGLYEGSGFIHVDTGRVRYWNGS